MRKYKFRYWDDEKEKMFGPFSLLELGCVDEDHLMQYIELKDKDGKEICEGDIVKYYNGSNDFTGDRGAVVEYHHGTFCVYAPYCYGKKERMARAKWIDGIWYDKYIFDDGHLDDGKDGYRCYPFNEMIEVIGNIHENPELIED